MSSRCRRRCPGRRRPSRGRARRCGRTSGCSCRVRPAPVRRSPRSSVDRCVCSPPNVQRTAPPTTRRPAACSGTTSQASGAGVPPSMFGGRSGLGVVRAQVRERAAERRRSFATLRLGDCARCPRSRALSKLARTSTGTVVAGDEHRAVGGLRGDRLAAERPCRPRPAAGSAPASGCCRTMLLTKTDSSVRTARRGDTASMPRTAGSSRGRPARPDRPSRPPSHPPSCRRSRRGRRRPAPRLRSPSRSGRACRGRSCAARGSRG